MNLETRAEVCGARFEVTAGALVVITSQSNYFCTFFFCDEFSFLSFLPVPSELSEYTISRISNQSKLKKSTETPLIGMILLLSNCKDYIDPPLCAIPSQYDAPMSRNWLKTPIFA